MSILRACISGLVEAKVPSPDSGLCDVGRFLAVALRALKGTMASFDQSVYCSGITYLTKSMCCVHAHLLVLGKLQGMKQGLDRYRPHLPQRFDRRAPDAVA